MKSRITYQTPTGEFGIDGVNLIELPQKLYAAVCKLKDYENKGLNPDDIDILKDRHDDFVEEVDRLKAENHEIREKYISPDAYELVKSQTVQWISVKDRLPEDNDGVVLVIVSGKPKENITLDGAYYLATYFEDGTWFIDSFPDWENPTVTHWMPLPEPPKEDE